jgi:hypothetical protein
MSKVVIIGIEGETGLWVVDLEAGTVAAVAAPASGDLKVADDLRKGGATLTRGVNLAAVVQSAASVSGGFLDS